MSGICSDELTTNLDEPAEHTNTCAGTRLQRLQRKQTVSVFSCTDLPRVQVALLVPFSLWFFSLSRTPQDQYPSLVSCPQGIDTCAVSTFQPVLGKHLHYVASLAYSEANSSRIVDVGAFLCVCRADGTRPRRRACSYVCRPRRRKLHAVGIHIDVPQTKGVPSFGHAP